MVPWLFAVSIVGLSLFQHTALMKYDPASSPSFSKSVLNLCLAAGLEIACNCWQNHVIKGFFYANDTSLFECFLTLWYTNTSFVSLPQAMYSLFTVRPTKFFSFVWPLNVRNWKRKRSWKSVEIGSRSKRHGKKWKMVQHRCSHISIESNESSVFCLEDCIFFLGKYHHNLLLNYPLHPISAMCCR